MSLSVGGESSKRVDPGKARPPEEAFVERLVSLGGKNGTPSTELRLFLTDWLAFLNKKFSHFADDF